MNYSVIMLDSLLYEKYVHVHVTLAGQMTLACASNCDVTKEFIVACGGEKWNKKSGVATHVYFARSEYN